MNTVRKNLLIAVAAFGIGSAAIGAQAQTQAPLAHPGHAATMEQRHAKMAEFMAKRQARLHDELKLTAAQEPAWAAFVAATKPQPMAQRPDRGAWKDLPAPARLEKMIALSKEHTARMESHLAALNTFYATLTPEQKKVFDQHAMHGMRRHHGHHGHEGMHG